MHFATFFSPICCVIKRRCSVPRPQKTMIVHYTNRVMTRRAAVPWSYPKSRKEIQTIKTMHLHQLHSYSSPPSHRFCISRRTGWPWCDASAAIFSAAEAMPHSGLSPAYGWHSAHSWHQLWLPNCSKIPFYLYNPIHVVRQRVEGWKKKKKPDSAHTWSRTISAFLPSAFTPLPSLTTRSCLWPFWQALPLAYTATISWARERCHVTPAKKHRHSPTFSRDRQRGKTVSPKTEIYPSGVRQRKGKILKVCD